MWGAQLEERLLCMYLVYLLNGITVSCNCNLAPHVYLLEVVGSAIISYLGMHHACSLIVACLETRWVVFFVGVAEIEVWEWGRDVRLHVSVPSEEKLGYERSGLLGEEWG